jgi:hypothetical protein
MPPQPRPKPQPPSRLSNLGYGLGDVEYLTDLYPYIKYDPTARLGLSGYDRGQTPGGLSDLIDTDPRHESRYAGTTLRGAYNPISDKIYVGTTDLDPEQFPFTVKYRSGLPVSAHELRHRGMQQLHGDDGPSTQEEHDFFDTYDSESIRYAYNLTPEKYLDMPDDERKFLARQKLIEPFDLSYSLSRERRNKKLDEKDRAARIELQRRGVPPPAVRKPQDMASKVMRFLSLID